MTLTCTQGRRRREQVAGSSQNGIDYVVTGQHSIDLHLLKPPSTELLRLLEAKPDRQQQAQGNERKLESRFFLIREQRRGVELTVTGANFRRDALRGWLPVIHLEVDRPRLDRVYRLDFVDLDCDQNRMARPPKGIDPRTASIDCVFYPEAASDRGSPGQQPDQWCCGPRDDEPGQTSARTNIDPQPRHVAPQPTGKDPAINYLARDYASLRQVILDRMSQVMPDWRERRAADIGTTIVEIMAFVGDRLSYHQDAVATESYLETARRRISVRRHARLLDYRVHEGCNARAFIHLQCTESKDLDPAKIYFITAPPRRYQVSQPVLREIDLPEDLFDNVIVFEPLAPPTLGPELVIDDIVEVPRFFDLACRACVDDGAIGGGDQAENTRREVFGNLRGLIDDKVRSDIQRCSEAEHSLGESAIKHLVQAINRCMLEQDLAQRPREMESDRVCGRAALPKDQRLWNNRKIIDDQFGEAITRSNPDRQIRLRPQHNEIRFYTWDEQECWLDRGATSATLIDEAPTRADSNCGDPADPDARVLELARGDILILEEVKGPRTGEASDADPRHRQAVRLTRVNRVVDPVNKTNIVEVRWHHDDALKFPLCLSSSSAAPRCALVGNVSIARGNVVIVDHGRTIANESIGTVTGTWRQINCGSEWDQPEWVQEIGAFTPSLREPRLTFAQQVEDDAPASRLADSHPRQATASLVLDSIPAAAASGQTLPINIGELRSPDSFYRTLAGWRNRPEQRQFAYAVDDLLDAELARQLASAGSDPSQDPPLTEKLAQQLRSRTTWQVADDLLAQGPSDRRFVVEMENGHRANLRFGNGQHGTRPEIGIHFFATYRVGSGVAGNVGAETIVHLVSRTGEGSEVVRLRNPLAAGGGVDPEPIANVKRDAPHAYRAKQLRTILEQDYVDAVLEAFPAQVQNARAYIRWEGAYLNVDVYIDPLASVQDFEPLRSAVADRLKPLRRIWHRVTVSRGVLVPIELEMIVCVRDSSLRSEVRRELFEVFSNRDLGTGRKGLFHPDNLTFGQSIHVSRLVLAARKVPGVENVVVTRLSRQGSHDNVATGLPAANITSAVSDDSGEVAAAAGEALSGSQSAQEIDLGRSNVLTFAPREIAQLDQSGSGIGGFFCVTLEGGK